MCNRWLSVGLSDSESPVVRAPRRRVSTLGLTIALALAGCANRNDARVRSAWNAGAGKSPEDGSPGGEDGRRDPAAGNDSTTTPKEGWERVDEVLGRALDVLTTAPSPDVFAQLANHWCEVEPIPRQTPHGQVRVCFLNPPVRVEGVALTLELSDSGIIGLVALDLTAEQSAGVATAARSATSHLCMGPWEDTPEATFSSCVLDGGSTLAIGRLATGTDASVEQDRSIWQVSIAILGAV